MAGATEATDTGAGVAAAVAVEPAPPMKVAGGLLWIAAGEPATLLAGEALPAAGSQAAGFGLALGAPAR